MNYYEKIKEKLIKCEIIDKVKDYSKERNRVITYFEIGKLLSEAGREYGKSIMKEYSEKLVIDVDKKYHIRTLYRMRKFYDVFSDEILTPMVSKLNWSQILIMLSIKDIDEIKYYINLCKKINITKRELEERIKNNEYGRLSTEVKNKLIKYEEAQIDELIPNPIIIRSNKKSDNLNEYVLQKIIMENINDFLSELGNGFTYVRNEYRIKIGNNYNYIDLLLFNYLYNCFIVIELKVTEFKKEHIGQIEVYMNYVDLNIKKENMNNTIGLIICKKENKFILAYSSDERIKVREYELL